VIVDDAVLIERIRAIHAASNGPERRNGLRRGRTEEQYQRGGHDDVTSDTLNPRPHPSTKSGQVQTMVKLATERKHLTDIIKMVAYQAESDLIALLRPHYARVDQEGRTLLHELFATEGDIHVTDGELNLNLAPLSSPHRTHAAQALCELLDKTATIFPG
jgi:transposase-like protein